MYFAHGTEEHSNVASGPSTALAVAVVVLGIFAAAAVMVFLRRAKGGTDPEDTDE